MPIKTSSAKAKGRRLQQWVRDRILAAFPKLDTSDVRSTSMGAAGEDVLLAKAARDVFPYSVECKSLKAVSIYKHVDQAKSNCPEGAEPLVIIKADRRKPLAVVDADHFIELSKGSRYDKNKVR